MKNDTSHVFCSLTSLESRCERRGSATSHPELLRTGGVPPLPTLYCYKCLRNLVVMVSLPFSHTRSRSHPWAGSHTHTQGHRVHCLKQWTETVLWGVTQSHCSLVHVCECLWLDWALVPKLIIAGRHIHPAQLCIWCKREFCPLLLITSPFLFFSSSAARFKLHQQTVTVCTASTTASNKKNTIKLSAH